MIFSNDHAKECKKLGHVVDKCNSCGAPKCLTENLCFATAEPVELTPELLGIKFRRDLSKLEARRG